MIKWLPVTEDFDKSLVIKKWRYDVNNDITGNYDGALSELPNIDIKTCWNNSRPENGYAFSNRFNLGQDYFSNRYYGFTDGYWTATTSSHTTLVEGTIYEFECPVDLYWAGNYSEPWNPNIPNMMWFGVESSFDIDPTEISAESGASSYTISVSAETGVSWSASTNDSWISLAPTTGEGNGSITVSVAEAGYTARTGEILMVPSEGDSISVPVSQAKKPLILTRKDMYRNGNVINKMMRNGELIYQRIYVPEPGE